jgi:biopolymer transport protein TolQ
MQASSDLSLLTLLLDASVPVQLVMLVLLVISVLSWTYIFI